MGGIELEDKLDNLKKYLKYIILVVAVILTIILLKSCNTKNYNKLETEVEEAALTYIKQKNINIIGEEYIELASLPEVEGTELCSKASGVIVKNNRGNLETTAYLDCDGYNTNIIKNNSKYAELNGDSVILLNKGEVFNDPLYVLKKDADVQIDGYVGSDVGIYTINYNVYVNNKLKETLSRKVIVTSSDKTQTISGLENKTAPIIILYGEKEIVLSVGEKYVDPGYKAVDYTDGKISRNVKVSPSKIPTDKSGNYLVHYSVTNSKGKTVTATRRVIVLKRMANININLKSRTTEISNKVILEIEVTGSDYKEMYLPDNTKTNATKTTYVATYNDSYPFIVVDRFGNRYQKEIVVDNIDNVPPVGTCKAVVTATSTTVTVDAYDNKGIAGYSYIIDNKNKTDFISKNSYEFDIQASKVQVILKDIVSNTNTLTCSVEKKLYDPNGIRVIVSDEPRLRIPIETALANKGHTVAELNKCIFDRVKKAGAGTRYGVVEAAYGLIECTKSLTGYVLAYDHEGGKVHIDSDGTNYCQFNSSICGKIGVNTNWGKSGGECPKPPCNYGLNCATFVRWSMCNGGMDLCSKGTAGAFSMTSSEYFPGADGVVINGKSVKYYSGTNLTNYDSLTLVKMLKPGDIAARELTTDIDGSSQHTFVIIGKDETGIYAANDGYYVDKISYSSMVSGEYYYRLLFLDKYYENPNNRNSFYK